jgi:hypothetical protein
MLAPGSAVAAPCYTHSEARAKWPSVHLFWHTDARCWDANARGAAHYDKRPTLHLQIMPPNVAAAAPLADVGTALASKASDATVLFPSLEVNAWPDANVRPELLSSSSVALWPLLIDIDVPLNFHPWRDRVSGTFK